MAYATQCTGTAYRVRHPWGVTHSSGASPSPVLKMPPTDEQVTQAAMAQFEDCQAFWS